MVFLAGLFFLCACAVAPFKPGRPISADGNFATRTFSQDGKTIAFNDAISGMKKNPASAEAASQAEIWNIVSALPAGVGGALIGYNGYNLLTGTTTDPTGLYVGVGFVGLSLVAVYVMDGYLLQAVEAYNGKPQKKSAGYSVLPTLVMTRFGVHHPTPLPGILISF